MEAISERYCGLDVHKRAVVACLVVPGPTGQPRKEPRSFGTMSDDLPRLADRPAAAGCTRVAMEGTGADRKPIWNLRDGRFELLPANARHVKAVPGRKTDVRDAEWLADLLRHGLVRGGFVPDRPQRELREPTRYRTSPLQERTAEVNRLQKALEGANVKLASVATDIRGLSGRQIAQGAPGGAGPRRDRRGRPRATGEGAAPRRAPRTGAGAGRVRRGAPALPAGAAVGPHRLPG